GIVVELDLALDLRAGVDDLEAAEGDAADAEAIGTRRHALCLHPEVAGAVAIAAEAGLGRSDPRLGHEEHVPGVDRRAGGAGRRSVAVVGYLDLETVAPGGADHDLLPAGIEAERQVPRRPRHAAKA